MTVQELVTRLPEIPTDLLDEPALERFAETFDELLCSARNPSACPTQHDAANHYYLKRLQGLCAMAHDSNTTRQDQIQLFPVIR